MQDAGHEADTGEGEQEVRERERTSDAGALVALRHFSAMP